MPELCKKRLLYFGTNISDILKLHMKQEILNFGRN